VSSQRRKSRKAYFTAPSSIRRKLMSAHLSKELKEKYETRSIPVRHGDTVKIKRGASKGKEGKVTEVYRRKWCIYIEKVMKSKVNGQEVKIPIHPSNVEVTQLRLDKDRKELLARKKRTASDKHKMTKMD
jgi:ribosomal protein uL24